MFLDSLPDKVALISQDNYAMYPKTIRMHLKICIAILGNFALFQEQDGANMIIV